jgi:hypothetical protein
MVQYDFFDFCLSMKFHFGPALLRETIGEAYVFKSTSHTDPPFEMTLFGSLGTSRPPPTLTGKLPPAFLGSTRENLIDRNTLRKWRTY